LEIHGEGEHEGGENVAKEVHRIITATSPPAMKHVSDHPAM
jgi:hypothetical protein